MIESKCNNCGTVFQVPKPGRYHCHNCFNTITVKEKEELPITSPILSFENSSEEENETRNIEYDPARHIFKTVPKTILSAVEIEGSLENKETTVPWENRKKLGLINAFFKTIKESIANPRRFFSNASSAKNNVNGSWLFAISVYFFALLIQSILKSIFSYSTMFSGTFNEFSAPGSLILLSLALHLLGCIICIVVGGALLNLGVKLMGARTRYEIGQIVFCYAFAANIFSIILLSGFGGLITIASSVYISSEGLKRFYGLTRGKAIFAALIPYIFLIVIALIIYKVNSL